MIPGRLVMTAGLDEEIQMDGLGHGAFPGKVRCSCWDRT
jgi:hypothetical protein